MPLLLGSCRLLLTFRAGLWNIGVEGQVILGAFAATAIFRQGTIADLAWLGSRQPRPNLCPVDPPPGRW